MAKVTEEEMHSLSCQLHLKHRGITRIETTRTRVDGFLHNNNKK